MSTEPDAAPQRRRRGAPKNEAASEEGGQPAPAEAGAPTESVPRRRGGKRAPRAAQPQTDAAVTPAAPQEPGVVIPNDVFLRNLPRTLVKESILALFTTEGLLKLRIIRRFGRLSAHASFPTPEKAAAVIAEVDGKVVEGRTIHAKPYEKRPARPRAPAAAPAAAASTDGATAQPAAAASADGAAKPARKRAPRRRGPKKADTGDAVDGAVAGAGAAGAGAGAPAAPRARKPRAPKAAGAAAAAPEQANPLSVWIGNLPQGATEADLRTTFAAFGTITEILVRPGFAYVHYDTADHAAAAVAALNNSKFGGNDIKVEPARPRRAARPPKREATNANPLKIWIGRLEEGYDVQKLTHLFAGALQIDQHDRYAYVTFDNTQNAQNALDKNNHPLFGDKPVSISVARY